MIRIGILIVSLSQSGTTFTIRIQSSERKSGSWNFTMSTGEHFQGSCGSSVNDWAYDVGGDTYYHIVGTSRSSLVSSGTCFGKDLSCLTIFTGTIIV